MPPTEMAEVVILPGRKQRLYLRAMAGDSVAALEWLARFGSDPRWRELRREMKREGHLRCSREERIPE